MNKVVVLIADGPNEVRVPCRIFPDMDTAKDRCDEIFGMEAKLTKSGNVIYDKDLEREEDPYPISNELFTSFYYGCGGAYRFSLAEVDFDTKFVGFNLD